ncbi:hypothetical protein J7E97_34880 [Streptomyces sp. ISL-66]|uniref:hypothetical protein n=1 Tax=Streptomyces sp. ISL-66 TaxID=2819186 RepID=UPI001BE6AE99|nr:hypothetical protein [Streptomyces sp. ISL-66]MBT2472897.1 hypothetical protein [Streptomyces sp. ISL-66]
MNRIEQTNDRQATGEAEIPWQHFREVLHAMDRLLERSAISGSSRGRFRTRGRKDLATGEQE